MGAAALCRRLGTVRRLDRHGGHTGGDAPHRASGHGPADGGDAWGLSVASFRASCMAQAHDARPPESPMAHAVGGSAWSVLAVLFTNGVRLLQTRKRDHDRSL